VPAVRGKRVWQRR